MNKLTTEQVRIARKLEAEGHKDVIAWEELHRKVLILFSGGVDSTVMTYKYFRAGYDCHTLFVQYGQRHAKEQVYFDHHSAKLGLPHTSLYLPDLGTVLASWLTCGKPSAGDPVVPNRNAFLLAIACVKAAEMGYDAVAFGAHKGDYEVFPDCRPEFFTPFEKAMQVSLQKPIKILTPFIDITKKDIVRLGRELNVPLEDTWSCYKGGLAPCGECAACRGRLEAGI